MLLSIQFNLMLVEFKANAAKFRGAFGIIRFAVTLREYIICRIMLPLVPVIAACLFVTICAPLEAIKVIVEVQGIPETGVQEVGLKEAVTPVGKFEAENETALKVPETCVAVTVESTELPGETLPKAGLTETPKSKPPLFPITA